MSAAGETWRKSREEIWPEKKKPVVKDLVTVCYPEHYGAQGMWYATKKIEQHDLEAFLMRHPGTEILDAGTEYSGGEDS